MKYRPLGTTGLLVSELSFGCAAIGQDYLGMGTYGDTAIKLIQKALEKGINFFDTAEAYGDGESERLLGEAFEGETNCLIATKVRVHGRTGENISESIRCSQVRLKRKIDLLQIHNPTLSDLLCEETMNALREILKRDLCSHLGASVYSVAEATEVMHVGAAEVIQAPYSTEKELFAETFKQAHGKGIGIIARQPFDRGRLAGTPESRREALDFCLDNPFISTVLVGMRNEQELEENISYVESRA